MQPRHVASKMMADERPMDFNNIKILIPFALLDELRSVPSGSDGQLFCKDFSGNDTLLKVHHTKDEYLSIAFPGSTASWNDDHNEVTASIQNFRRQAQRRRVVKSARQLLGLDQKDEREGDADEPVAHDAFKPPPAQTYTGKKRGRKPKGYYDQLKVEKEAVNAMNAGQSPTPSVTESQEVEASIPGMPESPLKFNFHAVVTQESSDISVEDIMTGRSASKVPDLGLMMTRRQRRTGHRNDRPMEEVEVKTCAVLKDPKMLRVLESVAPTELLDEHFDVLTDDGNRRAGLKCKHCEEIAPTRKDFLFHLKSHVYFTPWHCPLCTYKAPHKSLLAKHLNIHAEVRSFVCDLCGQGFTMKEKLQLHMKYHENDRNCTCPHCDVEFHEYKTLRSHINTFHKDVANVMEQDENEDGDSEEKRRKTGHQRGTYKTRRKTQQHRAFQEGIPNIQVKEEILDGTGADGKPQNGSRYTFANKKPLNYTLLIDNYCTITHENGRKQIMCNECGEKFYKKIPFLYHLRDKHRDAKPYKCSTCDYTSRTKPNVFTHMKTHTKKEHSCTICGKDFHFGYKLALHMRYHLNERQFKCDICSQRFNNMVDVRKHKERIHTKGRPFLCDTCGKDFKYVLAYKRHLMTHIPGKRETCIYCNKMYKSKQSLRIHMQCHTTIFQCQICNKNINSYTAFVAHKNLHDPNYIGFPCKVCGKMLQTKSSLDKHLATAHSSARPHKCDTCGKAFKIPEHLKLHMVTHDNVKKFSCTICGLTTKRRSSLMIHMRRHLQSNAFICEDCGRIFQDKAELQTHMSTHMGESMAWCPFCDRRFTSQPVLEKHIESAHTGEQIDIQSVVMDGITDVISDMNNVIVEGERSQNNQLFLCEQCNASFESQEILAMHILTDHMKQHLDIGQEIPSQSIKMETDLSGGTLVSVQTLSIPEVKVEDVTCNLLDDVVNTVEINTDILPGHSEGTVPLHSMIIQDVNDTGVVVHSNSIPFFLPGPSDTESVITSQQSEANAAAQVISEQAHLE